MFCASLYRFITQLVGFTNSFLCAVQSQFGFPSKIVNLRIDIFDKRNSGINFSNYLIEPGRNRFKLIFKAPYVGDHILK